MPEDEGQLLDADAAKRSSSGSLPTGTVTLLFTDIEGSTRLLQQLGTGYEVLLEDCRNLLRRAFQAHHGHEVDTQRDSFSRGLCSCH